VDSLNKESSNKDQDYEHHKNSNHQHHGNMSQEDKAGSNTAHQEH